MGDRVSPNARIASRSNNREVQATPPTKQQSTPERVLFSSVNWRHDRAEATKE
jgi:hypothetical protein